MQRREQMAKFDVQEVDSQRAPSPATTAGSARGWDLHNGRFMFPPNDISQFLIPEFAGATSVSGKTQDRFLIAYMAVMAIGLALFYGVEPSRIRVLGLGMTFPGAGFIAVGGIKGFSGFGISLVFLPLCLFAWVGAGAVAAPIVHWVLSAAAATMLANRDEEGLFDLAAVVVVGFISFTYMYLKRSSSNGRDTDEKKRQSRNRILTEETDTWAEKASAGSPPGSRELSLDQLRWIQWVVELGLQAEDDWSNFNEIDQFQTSSFRYQLYEIVYCLGTYHSLYVPSYHGASELAMRNAIEKSFTTKVLGYWKWESLWGNFTTDWDPIKKDNIMVTGYLLLALAIYAKSTGDERYMKEGSMHMKVTESDTYKYDMQSCYKALFNNWKQSRFTLFPCEPSWIYGGCNSAAIAAATACDGIFKSKEAESLMNTFYRRFEEEFVTQSGSCVTIRSGLTGFAIPGVSVVSDCISALYIAPSMPVLARRLWLVCKSESVRMNDDGSVELKDLKGPDKLDPGNYGSSPRFVHAIFAAAAAEWGDAEISDAMIKRIDEEFAPVQVTSTGSRRNTGMSVFTQGILNRARIMRGGDWRRTVAMDPPKQSLAGPCLKSAAFPEVLVAKAFSKDSKCLELVLYPGKNNGVFELEISNLIPGVTYRCEGIQAFSASKDGIARINVELKGRTAFSIEPVA